MRSSQTAVGNRAAAATSAASEDDAGTFASEVLTLAL